MTIRAFEVGGCVRDGILADMRGEIDFEPHDVDFAVEAPSFAAMRDWLVGRRFEIFVETPEFFTIRARFPRDDPRHARLTADFALCRRDGMSSDGRHPDTVASGTAAEDRARRDFTVNAMMLDPDTGEIIDDHGGQEDLRAMLLRFVGDPVDRLNEDALRALRAVRFCITKGFTLAADTGAALCDPALAARLVGVVKIERVREELRGAFKADTIGTIRLLDSLGLLEPLFVDGLWLEPTGRKRPKGS